MSIIRAPRPETRFYTLDKSISEDQRLSWAARGLLIFLLGKPDNWEVSVKHLINQTQEAIGKASGRDAVRGILKELEDAGYLKVDIARADGGAFNGMAYTVSEIPDFQRQPANPAPVEPETENPAPAEPAPANPHLTSNEVKQPTELEQESTGASAPCDGFEAAWKLYPKREGSNPKNKAHSCWKARLKDGVTAETMMAGLMRYAAYCKIKGFTGTSYVMQGVRFFGKGMEFENDWSVTAASGKVSMMSQNFQSKTYEGSSNDQFAEYFQ